MKKCNVIYKYDPNVFFSKEWLSEPINATGKEIDQDQIPRIDGLIEKFFNLFPKKIIEQNLKNIYFLKYMKFYNIEGWGGTRSEDSIYCILHKEYDDNDVLEIMVEEFSSILMMNYDFDECKWNSFNFSDFKYSGDGTEVLDEDNLLNSNENLWANGFINKYAMSSIENDFNQISRWLFMRYDKLMEICNRFPIIKRKTEYTKKFYEKVGIKFD